MSLPLPSTPGSRVPSRSATPASHKSPNTKLLIPPALRSNSSFASLRTGAMPTVTTSTSSTASAISQSLDTNLDITPTSHSSSSSISDSDPADGTLFRNVDDVETDVNDDEASVSARPEDSPTDEESRRHLRDQLRRSLSSHHSSPVMEIPKQRIQLKGDILEIGHNAQSIYPPREYFILTDAGKPVYTSRPGGESSEFMTSAVGITQALISIFLDNGDKLRCINAGNTRITFLLRPPLYYVCVSSWKEPESVTRSHLEYLHLQLLSIIPLSQLRRIFEKRTNFDLRRFLGGTQGLLDGMLQRLQLDMAMATSSLHCLKMDNGLRSRLADAIVPMAKMKGVLYVMLLARGRVITLIRPRNHSIHPSDIHILLNTIYSPAVLKSSAPASWVPICLPKFNPTGIVYSYVSFFRRDRDPPNDSGAPTSDAQSGSSEEGDPNIALVCIGGSEDYETIRSWCNAAVLKLEADGSLDQAVRYISSGATEYTVGELGVPGLRHFLYKARAQVQVTSPSFEDPYDDLNERKRLVVLYQILHDRIHARSGQATSLKLQYIRTEKEGVLGWITQPFELYIAFSPLLPKTAVIHGANAVMRWIKKEESRLFLKDAPVF